MRWPWIVAGVSAVAVVVWLLAPGEEAGEAPAAGTAAGSARGAGRPGRRPNRPGPSALRPKPFVQGAASVTQRAGAEPGPEPNPPPPTGVAEPEARAGLDRVLEQIETLADEQVVLDPAGYARWRDRANAAFAAYSALLDGHDPQDVEQLEEAHRRLARALRALEGRVREEPIRRRGRGRGREVP